MSRLAPFRASGGMRVDGVPIGDDEAFGPQRFEPDIIGATGQCSSNSGIEKLLEGGEQYALQVDRQRQQPIEKGRDRRQLVADARVVHQAEAGGALEELERAAIDLAADDQQVKLAQRVARVGAFEIVLGSEEALSAGLALAAGDCPERVEPAGDGCRNFAMEISPAYVGVAIERRQADTG